MINNIEELSDALERDIKYNMEQILTQTAPQTASH